ncbi:hypothetical protein [Psychroserpens sp. MEBiC05023]
MKKIKIVVLSLMVAAFFGCDENDNINTTFDSVNGQTLVAFAGTSTNLPILIDGTGSADISVEVSTVSSTDRNVSYTIVTEGDATTVLPANYMLSPSILVPANSHIGTLTVTGIDDENLGTAAETLTIVITDIDGGGTINDAPHVINLFQVCPVPETFMIGNYLMEQVTPFLGGSATLSDGSITTITADGTSRTFDTFNYPVFCTTNNPFTFNLVCNEINVPTQRCNCVCNTGTDWFTQPTVAESYDLSDDTEFFLTFTDDTQADCGATAQTTYKFTKQ